MTGKAAAPHVVIVGGGFGGLHAAKGLRRAPVRVTLVDRHNYHLFQPLLYQVATGTLSPANIAAPLRRILRRQRNLRVWLGEIIDLDTRARKVRLGDGEFLYDCLILAAGVTHHYFGHEEWAGHAPGLKTIDDATHMRRRILLAFEAAEREIDPERVREWLTFVVVGGGATGVELAGALAEIARHSLRHDFRAIDPSRARIVLVEAGARILPACAADLSRRAARTLESRGVEVRTQTFVINVEPGRVTWRSGNREEAVAAHMVLWAAGVRASPLGTVLARTPGVATDESGRVRVERDCSVSGLAGVFVIGDLAHHPGADGRPLPGIAQVAIQQGRYVARRIGDQVRGRPTGPFRYRDFGIMAVIGRTAAVADLGWIRFGGRPAWLAWLFIHLMQLVEFGNRILVLVQWAWNYLTFGRAARLITGPDDPAPPPDPDRNSIRFIQEGKG